MNVEYKPQEITKHPLRTNDQGYLLRPRPHLKPNTYATCHSTGERISDKGLLFEKGDFKIQVLTGKELNAPAYIAITASACNPAHEDMRSQFISCY